MAFRFVLGDKKRECLAPYFLVALDHEFWRRGQCLEVLEHYWVTRASLRGLNECIMQMNFLPKEEIERAANFQGCRVSAKHPMKSSGPSFEDYMFVWKRTGYRKTYCDLVTNKDAFAFSNDCRMRSRLEAPGHEVLPCRAVPRQVFLDGRF